MSVGRAAMPVGAIGGIVMMLLGVLFFALNDTMGKWLLGTYAVGQLMLVRSISGLCVMAPAIHRVGLSGFRDAPRPDCSWCEQASRHLKPRSSFGVSARCRWPRS